MEFAAEGGFASGHFAVVCFVVFAGEVEEAVEDEDFDWRMSRGWCGELGCEAQLR